MSEIRQGVYGLPQGGVIENSHKENFKALI